MILQADYGLRCCRGFLLLAVLLFSLPFSSTAGDEVEVESEAQPVIAIIIDDVGNKLQAGEEVLALPGPVTLAFLPHTPHAKSLARRAHGVGKEVMLHLPMESHAGNRLGPGALTLHMTEEDFRRSLKESLDSIPHVAGLNNHMGSLLTRHPGAMDWLMSGMQEYGELYFIDSRTTKETVAEQVAREHQVPVARRDVFLDNDRNPAAIERQFRELLRLARRQGYAVGIGHPYEETMELLKQELPRLEAEGVRLIHVSELVQHQGSNTTWPESSSPSPKVVKNLKP
jgi:polysaccharide deacetylase 2 family uncharacterized protein YibQ